MMVHNTMALDHLVNIFSAKYRVSKSNAHLYALVI